MNFLIISNILKDKNYSLTKKIELYITRTGNTFTTYDVSDMETVEINSDLPDIVLSIGGDGTLLSAGRFSIQYDLPIIGVNLGNVGFLTEISPNSFIKDIDDIINGRYIIEDRILIDLYDINNILLGTAINDVVIKNLNPQGVGYFELYIDNIQVNSMRGDGALVATPTGSTGYSLSTGGPIVNPNCNLIIVSPINAHSLSSKPIIISDKEVAKIRFDSETTSIAVDGMPICCKNNIAVVRKSLKTFKFIRLNKYNFYNELRKKLN